MKKKEPIKCDLSYNRLIALIRKEIIDNGINSIKLKIDYLKQSTSVIIPNGANDKEHLIEIYERCMNDRIEKLEKKGGNNG